jgi:hypothetical protein
MIVLYVGNRNRVLPDFIHPSLPPWVSLHPNLAAVCAKFAELALARAQMFDVHFARPGDLHAMRDFLTTDCGNSVLLYRVEPNGARGEEVDLPRKVNEIPPDQSEAA